MTAAPPPVLTRVRRYRIVVGVDLSDYADIVLEHALDQAARHDAPELHLLAVRERRRQPSDEVTRRLWERVQPALETFNAHGTDWRARLHVRLGRPEIQIAELAAELAADLIVIGSFGLHHRPVANRVVEAAVCPTLVVGMPAAAETRPQCPACVLVRDDSDGERWFCDDHQASPRTEHARTPMTVWTAGKFAIDRATA